MDYIVRALYITFLQVQGYYRTKNVENVVILLSGEGLKFDRINYFGFTLNFKEIKVF